MHNETDSTPSDINAVPPAPVDFGRRRVTRILRRERPRGEQHSWLEFDINNILIDTMSAHRKTALPPRWTLNDQGRWVFLFCKWRGCAIWGGRLIGPCYVLRKGKTANTNSRFLPDPRK